MDANLTNLRDAIDAKEAALAAAILSLQQGQAGGTLGYETKAAMDADLAHTAGTLAIVTNNNGSTADPDNGYYIKLGGSGSGSWQKSAVSLTVPIVDARDYASFAAAVAAHPSDLCVLAISTVMPVTSAVTVPSTMDIIHLGGYLSISGGGSVAGMKRATPQMFGAAVNAASITYAIASVMDGGTVDIGNAGDITVSTQIPVNHSCAILLGKTTLTTALTTAMFLVKASGVSFIGVSPYVSRLTNTDTATGNIIQWGASAEAHQYTDMVVRDIRFTLGIYATGGGGNRTHMGGIVALTESLNTITANERLTVERCMFIDGADQISLEQVDHAEVRDCVFTNGKGRGVMLWNCDYYKLNHNTYIDTAGTSVNFNESFQTGSLNKGCDYGEIADNLIIGTAWEGIAVKGIGTKVTGNRLLNVKGTGIAITDPNNTSTQTVHEILVDHNEIFCIGGGTGGIGIVLTNSTADPYGVTISNNMIDMSGTSMQGVVSSGAGSSRIKLINNTVLRHDATGANLDGVQIANATGSDFSGNTIDGWTRYGIYLNTTYDSSIVGNTVKNSTSHGIRLEAGGGHYVTDNYLLDNGGYGIHVAASDIVDIRIPNTNRYHGNASGGMSPHLVYMGDQTRVDTTILPVSGYMEAGDIVWRGSGTVAGGSPGWVCTAAGYLLKGSWTTSTAYTAGQMVSNSGNIYIATNTATSGATAPTHGSGTVSDGAVNWRFIAVGAAATTKTMPSVGS
jgi:parallel beta-helix repeat protein